MNTDEIVRALRDYASCCDDDEACFQCTFACVYGKCGKNAPKIIADLIENLTSRLTDYHHMEQLVDGKMAENQRLRKINEKLQSQLAVSRRREQAAVEDLNGTGACFTCKHFRRNGGDCFGAGRCRLDGIEIWPCNEPGVYRVEVPDDGRQTYEWRGPQAAGKGEAE